MEENDGSVTGRGRTELSRSQRETWKEEQQEKAGESDGWRAQPERRDTHLKPRHVPGGAWVSKKSTYPYEQHFIQVHLPDFSLMAKSLIVFTFTEGLGHTEGGQTSSTPGALIKPSERRYGRDILTAEKDRKETLGEAEETGKREDGRGRGRVSENRKEEYGA
ncbi:hypothetical protein NDU88_000183 [Pleurodeles waltl]|uniref:Uncharacterized protein n=1 Tax=Pleurodeles waltl TaxID=8319 RepID=A0AAV7LC71_PLEWA|nr:hypothetical protein NDU88_000183 [Pleurodeles waltl]